MDFTKIYQQYKGLWVALSSDEKKVLGKGKTIRTAVKQAQQKGVKTPYLFKVPTKILPYVSAGYEV
jgi:hypothetical protein